MYVLSADGVTTAASLANEHASNAALLGTTTMLWPCIFVKRTVCPASTVSALLLSSINPDSQSQSVAAFVDAGKVSTGG